MSGKRINKAAAPVAVDHGADDNAGSWLGPAERTDITEAEIEAIAIVCGRLRAGPCGGRGKCCDRAGEYNGFSSGPLSFTCPKSCMCHD